MGSAVAPRGAPAPGVGGVTGAGQHEIEARVAAIGDKLESYREDGRRMFATSSFQTTSVVLLHILSIRARDVPVYFLDTGYHFPETLEFKRELEGRLGLEVRSLRSEVSRLLQRDARKRLLFASDPDSCCYLNKVAPLEPVLAAHDIWINGIRASQSPGRAAFQVEQSTRRGTVRYHPLLDWTAAMLDEYRRRHDLPAHPLDALGYGSVGCEPCTRRAATGGGADDRSGRWAGLTKTECGLHL